MKSANPDIGPRHVSKGDIFDDLGFSPEETLEAKIKADIWRALIQHIDRSGLTKAKLVTLLKVHQPDVSNLLKGKIARFSIIQLIQFAGRLNLTTQVKVMPAKIAAALRCEKSVSGNASKKQAFSRIRRLIETGHDKGCHDGDFNAPVTG